MMDKTPPPSDAQLQAEATKRSRANDFKKTFGFGPSRTEEQARTLAYLESCADEEKNSYEFNSPKDGLSLIAAGIHRDGAKSILRIIHRNLSYADQQAPTPKVKAASKR